MMLMLYVHTIIILGELYNQGGNFHLKVGGAKSSGNAGDPMLGVAVNGGSRIYKRGGGGGGERGGLGHKIMDACCLYDHTFII